MKSFAVILFFLMVSIHRLSAQQMPPPFGAPVLSTSLNTHVNAVEWNQGASYLAVATDTGLFVLNEHLQGVITRYDHQRIVGISWKPDGSEFAVVYSQQVDIWTWNSSNESAQLLTTLPLGGEAIGVYWRPDGTQLASLHFDPLFYPNPTEGSTDVYPAIILFWNTDNWDSFIRASGEYYGLNRNYLNNNLMTWIPNQSRVVMLRYAYSYAILINTSSGEVVKEVPLADGRYYSVSANPTISNVIAIGDDLGVGFYDINTGAILREFSLIAFDVTSVSWSPDGRYVYAGGYIADFITRTELISNNPFACFTQWDTQYRVTSVSCNGTIRIENISNIPAIIIPTPTPTNTP